MIQYSDQEGGVKMPITLPSPKAKMTCDGGYARLLGKHVRGIVPDF